MTLSTELYYFKVADKDCLMEFGPSVEDMYPTAGATQTIYTFKLYLFLASFTALRTYLNEQRDYSMDYLL